MFEDHPNFAAIEASRLELVDLLQRRRQHWVEIQEISENQAQRARDNIVSCDQQLHDLGEDTNGTEQL